MAARLTLALCVLAAPLVAGADTLEVYGSLTGKTVLMPTTLPRLPDAIIGPTCRSGPDRTPLHGSRKRSPSRGWKSSRMGLIS